VLKVKAKGRRDHVTVAGSLPSFSAGESVTAEGRWEQNLEFGLQLRAEMLNTTAPTTKEGICGRRLKSAFEADPDHANHVVLVCNCLRDRAARTGR